MSETRRQPARRSRRERRSPFGGLRPVMVVVSCYALAVLVWVVAGAELPGGRWMAVHLFTLGVLTNLVVALTHHFAQTLLHAPNEDRRARLVLTNAGVLLLLFGLPAGRTWLVAVGATTVTAAVLWLYVDLRRARKASLTGRFAFVVRSYERACSAFIHGAIVGALMGTGMLGGGWYSAGRLAHLHVNILGWGGLTLLSTIVFFAPTVMRTRMEPEADAAAARWLGRSATGLSVTFFALLATGAGGAVVVPARLVAAGGLVLYGIAAAAVCLPVIRTAERAKTTARGTMLQAACCWFTAAVAADVIVVATGQMRLLDALGIVMIVGVLAQTILGTLSYLVPVAWARSSAERGDALARLDVLPWTRAITLNFGVALVAVATAQRALGVTPPLIGRLGWLLVLAAIAVHLVLLAVTMARASTPAPTKA